MREVRGRREGVEVQRDLVDPEMDAPALIGLLGMINKGMKYISMLGYVMLKDQHGQTLAFEVPTLSGVRWQQ